MTQANANQSAQDFNMDALLDGTLDDMADMPEFRPFPIGTYSAQFSIVPDPKKNKFVYYAKLKVLETVELADEAEVPVEVGAEAQVRYDMSNEYGQGAFKKLLKILADHFGAKSNRELIADAVNPIDVIVITKHNINKKNQQVYTDIVEMQIV